MSAQSLNDLVLLRAALDAIPSYVLVVDEDVKIVEYNAAAGWLLGIDREEILQNRGGDLLRCVHARQHPEGCGHSEFCKICIIRDSVDQAFAGKHIIRRRGLMQLESGQQASDLHILVSASVVSLDGQDLAMVVIEDINLLVELQRIVPVCMSCQKVRDDEPFWQEVNSYFERHWATRFSHGLCPDCAANEMGRIEPLFPANGSNPASDASAKPSEKP
jgi:hypothetical protein